jgi:hypothetical protein
MFTPEQFRAKAAEYVELGKMANSPNEIREFQELERRFTTLADNEQWLRDNHHRTVHSTEHHGTSEVVLAAEEERVLRCLGAAVIMHWNTLPRKLHVPLEARHMVAGASTRFASDPNRTLRLTDVVMRSRPKQREPGSLMTFPGH